MNWSYEEILNLEESSYESLNRYPEPEWSPGVDEDGLAAERETASLCNEVLEAYCDAFKGSSKNAKPATFLLPTGAMRCLVNLRRMTESRPLIHMDRDRP